MCSRRFGLTGEQAVETLRSAHISGILRPLQGVFYGDSVMPITPDIDYCPYPNDMKCNAFHNQQLQWIRSIDGSCNNGKRPIIGRSMTPFRRLLPAHYHDGMFDQPADNLCDILGLLFSAVFRCICELCEYFCFRRHLVYDEA